MQETALQLLVILMMLAVGLELTVADLAEIARRRSWFAGAFVVNVVLVPVGAGLLGAVLPVSAGWAAGLVLLAAAPGGPVGPALARIAHADLAFSTALMVGLGFIGLVSVPLTVTTLVGPTVGSAGGRGVFWPMFRMLFVFQIVPLVAALATRSKYPQRAARLVGPVRRAGNGLLVGVVLALVVARGRSLIATPLAVHVAIVIVLGAMLSPLVWTGRTWPSRRRHRSVIRGLAVVTVVRNMSVALLLAAGYSTDPDVEVAILICSFWILVLPAAGGLMVRRRGRVLEPGGSLGRPAAEAHDL